MQEDYQDRVNKAKSNRKSVNSFLKKINKKPPNNLDSKALEFHNEVSDDTDCLACANCCKTTSPIFRPIDVNRISKHLNVKPSDFFDQYLKEDEDGDMVLKQSPCHFLGEDNKCNIYQVRPLACREYPHTDRKKFHQITHLTAKNTRLCPIAAEVVEKLRIHYS